MTVWVVVEDTQKAVGLALPKNLVPALIAGCANNPTSFEELLTSADFYAQGLASVVTNSLLDGDRGSANGKTSRSGHVAEEHPRRAIGQLLGRTGDDGLLYIDLNEQALVAHGRAAEITHKRGEVEITSHGNPTGRKVTYQLGQRWHITSQREV